MSSAASSSDGLGGTPGAATPTPGPASTTATFWCHECDMSVALHLSSPPLACPHCGGGFLEEMEAPHPRRPRSRSLSPPRGAGALDRDDHLAGPSLGGGLHGGGPASPSAAEDYYEVFDRLISHIVSSSPDPIDPGGAADVGVPRPASRSSVAAIPTVQITEAFLAADPALLCAVCKDEFVVQTEARQLPCSHIYHPDCILPWLSHHNSCPVCRFRFPTEDPDRRRRPARVDQPRVVFGNLVDDEVDEEVDRDVREIHTMLRAVFPGRTGLAMEETDAFAEANGDFLGIGRILRRVARRQRLSSSRSSPRPVVQDAAPTTATQLAQVEIASEGPANSGETVSSLWPLDEGTSVGGNASGSGGRVDDEGDMVMSEVRSLYS
ncbi:hypothetical protein Taro_018019 [Colocasia esculenta]|uniref:RING-type E3 ubiquitin transferase n=1 Tax=Colocasia esculenta TaxID=4460 RepID=A0A843UUZ4_COLES|nr:hypothetical protein [Colocasia esculenta]